MISWPWERSSAATAEESTPPDMATAIVLLGSLIKFLIPSIRGYPPYYGCKIFLTNGLRVIVSRKIFQTNGLRAKYSKQVV